MNVADWEMATMALSSERTPQCMGLSSHYGGTRRDWQDVQKIGERPVIYAARGSHANYPWGKGGREPRWINPAAWVASCRPAGGLR
jgi:hypothetical protein